MHPKHPTKQEFGRRLYRLILERGWTQSELARRADVLRDSVSNYVRGNTLPDPVNLKKIADALSVDMDDLLPGHFEGADVDDTSSLEFKVSASDPGKSWLRVNRAVSTKTAVDIIKMLNDDIADGN